jgi:hypothetical protein
VGLGTYPAAHEDEWLGAPGYSFLGGGPWGTPLFDGFGGSGQHQYFFLPLGSLLGGALFRVLGTGLWQARLLTLVLALVLLALTQALAERHLTAWHGALGVAVLTLLPIAGPMPFYPSGIPLMDLARHARYDLGAAVFGFGALWASRGRIATLPQAAGVGALLGLATLCHVYGALFGAWLWLDVAPGARWRLRAALLASGAGVLVPWLLFIAQAPGDFAVQTHSYAGRFSLGSPRFYLHNLLGEPWRYSPVWGARRTPGMWLYLGLVGAGAVRWARGGGRGPSAPLLGTALCLALGLALFIQPKPWVYLAVLWPLYALMAADGLVALSTRLRFDVRGAFVVLGLLSVPAALRMRAGLAEATPYADLCARIAQSIPKGSHVSAHHLFWMGLVGAFPDVRSTLVPMMRCMPGTSPSPVDCDEAYRDGWTDYFVFGAVEADVVRSGEAHPELRAPGAALARLRAAHPPVAVIDDATYGHIEVLQVR